MPRNQTPKQRRQDERAGVEPTAAGLAIGSAEIGVAVPPGRDAEPVRVVATFTADLPALLAGLRACGIDPVAMESTGVFWLPMYALHTLASSADIRATTWRDTGAPRLAVSRDSSCIRSGMKRN